MLKVNLQTALAASFLTAVSLASAGVAALMTIREMLWRRAERAERLRRWPRHHLRRDVQVDYQGNAWKLVPREPAPR